MSTNARRAPVAPGPSGPTIAALFLSFLRLGAVSFGGPAMVAYIRRLAVRQRSWVGEDEFERGVALYQAVPGATAMQCAAWVGLRARGLSGAVAAYVGFGLPAFVLMLALSYAYSRAHDLRIVTSALAGLRALVVALAANACWVFARRSVTGGREGAIAVIAAGLFLLGGNPFLIVVAAGLAGALVLRGDESGRVAAAASAIASPRGAFRGPALVIAVAGAVVAAAFALGGRRLGALGLLMMKVDLFAFGGGFAAVPLMFDEVVGRGWMPARTFLDGIALGQVTPGPIVITATFVGYQVAGMLGAVVATLCIFSPSLFTLVLVEPWFDRFRSSAVSGAVSRGLVLSFVGLLASVTVQFARLMPWNAFSVALAVLALAALMVEVEAVWVVIAGALLSTLVL